MNHVGKQPGWVGRQFNRKEDYRLTTGKGQYFADMVVPGRCILFSCAASTRMPSSSGLT